MSAPVRLGLTVPGAVALGAYEAGAVAALVVGIQALRGAGAEITLDAIGASSSGAITALLAARCLLEGTDPVSTLRTAWVTDAQISSLLASGTAAPLSLETLRAASARLLVHGGGTKAARQDSPVTISIGLNNLRGLAYRLPSVTSMEHRVVTHLDWVEVHLEPGTPQEALTTPRGASPVDIVLASASNPLGFPPLLIDRSAAMPAYAAAGVTNLPPGGQFWSSDPAPLMREPIGQTIRLAKLLDVGAARVRRAHLVIEPQPLVPDTGNAWADPSAPPDWLAVLRRVGRIVLAQSVFADLSALEETNLRLVRVVDAADRLAGVVKDFPPEIRDRLLDALESKPRQASGDVAPEGSVADRVRVALSDMAGVTGKEAIPIDVISPRSLDPDALPDALLAGETLGRFGGFLDERLRESDFNLGWRSAFAWLNSERLSALGVSEPHRAAALAAVDMANPVAAARSAVPRLRPHSYVDIGRLAIRVGRVSICDLWRRRRNRTNSGTT